MRGLYPNFSPLSMAFLNDEQNMQSNLTFALWAMGFVRTG